MAADDALASGDIAPAIKLLAGELAEALFDPAKLERIEHALSNATARGQTTASGAAVAGALALKAEAGDVVTKVDDFMRGSTAYLLAHIVAHLLGVEVPASALRDAFKGGPESIVGKALGRTVLSGIEGAGGQIEPGDAGALRMIGMVTNMTMTGWFEGILAEELTSLGGILHPIEEISGLARELIGGLGMNRLMRVALRPLVRATVSTPLEWKVNKQYRPQLLSVAAAIDAHLAGRFTPAQLAEETARQGFSDDRVAIMVEGARKRLGVADVRTLVYRNIWDEQKGLEYLKASGYDQQTADDTQRVLGTRRVEQLEDAEASAIIAAYVSRDIDELTFTRLIGKAVTNPPELVFQMELANVRRTCNVRHITATRMRQLVKDEIATMQDFRDALEREGYLPKYITLEELSLRVEMQKARDVEQARADAAADKAKAQDEAAAAKAQRDRELADRQARAAFPSLNEYRKAYVHGLVDRALFVDAIAREHITEQADVILADADADRATYLDNQAKKAAAAAADPLPKTPIGDVEQQVLRGIVDVTTYTTALALRGFSDAEQRAMVALLNAKLDDQAAAKTKRAEADAKAAAAGVSLSAWERAVRLGARTMSEYAAYLDSIQTSDVGKALMLDVLQAQLDADTEARAKRDAAATAAAEKGIALERRRRAVVAGVRPRSYYEQALIAAKVPVSDQQLELDLLDAEMADAASARARRDEIAAETAARQIQADQARAVREAAGQKVPAAPTLTLGQVERAVVLGILDAGALRTFATDRGYSPDDAELLVALAVAKVPDTRAGQQRQAVVAKELAAKGISLAEFTKAVRRGLRTVDDYRALLTAAGYGVDDVELLAELLTEEVAVDQVGLRKRIAATLAKGDGSVSLEALESAAASGAIAVDTFVSALAGVGVDPNDALVYGRLLVLFGVEG